MSIWHLHFTKCEWNLNFEIVKKSSTTLGHANKTLHQKLLGLRCTCRSWQCDLLFTGVFNIVDDVSRNVYALATMRMYINLLYAHIFGALSGRISGQLFNESDQSCFAFNSIFSHLFLFFSGVCLNIVPDGKPQVTSAHNSSSTSIYLNWKPPPKSSIHGEFLGYRLAYKQRDDTSSESVQEIFLRDPSIEVCVA